MGQSEHHHRIKAYFIGYMVKRLIKTYLGVGEHYDRDNLGNKRIDLAGSLLQTLFDQGFRHHYIEHAKKYLNRKLNSKNAGVYITKRLIGLVFD